MVGLVSTLLIDLPELGSCSISKIIAIYHNCNNGESMTGTHLEAFQRFWEDKGRDCVDIVETMSSKEDWAMDWAIRDKLDELYYAFERSDFKDVVKEISLYDVVTLSSWLSSPISIALLSKFDNAAPGAIMKMLELPNGKATLGVVFTIFVERIGAFSKARLLGEIFSEDRIRKMERLIEKVVIK